MPFWWPNSRVIKRDGQAIFRKRLPKNMTDALVLPDHGEKGSGVALSSYAGRAPLCFAKLRRGKQLIGNLTTCTRKKILNPIYNFSKSHLKI